MSTRTAPGSLPDLRPRAADIRSDVLAGLARRPKRLPSKYFYDARGSWLFERICEQPEYYLTRAELALMRSHVRTMAETLGPRVVLIEFGSGSGVKTRLLLEHLDDAVAYVPVEISTSALAVSVASLAARFPRIEMLPVCADFTQPLTLPRPARRGERTVIYFPGSTIGNFEGDSAVRLLRHMRDEMGPSGAALVGVDLIKSPTVIDAAYNDAAGITAEFTLNLLRRLNEELDANFELENFRHDARYYAQRERIETYIVSRIAQDVTVCGQRFHFTEGEAVLVELSCKYSIASFARLAWRAGLRVSHVWTDRDESFSVQCLTPAPVGSLDRRPARQ